MNEQRPRPDQNQKRNPGGGFENPDTTEDQETPGRGNPPSGGGIDSDRGTGNTGTGGGFSKK